MMKQVIAALAIMYTQAMQPRSHQWMGKGEWQQDTAGAMFGWFIAIAVIMVIIFCCCVFLCRNKNLNHVHYDDHHDIHEHEHHFHHPPPPVYAHNCNPPPNYNQSPNYYPLVNQAFNYQPSPTQLPVNPYANSNNNPTRSSWNQGSAVPYNIFAKINQPCGICQTLTSNGEQTNVMLDCSNNHCFHLNCLSDNRRFQTESNRNPNNCPVCYEQCSGTAKLFCSNCKKGNVEINLIANSNRDGSINLDVIRGHYGNACPACKVK